MSTAERIERTIAQLERTAQQPGWTKAEIRDIENVISELKAKLEKLK